MQTLHRILVTLPALLAFGCLPPKGDLGQYTATDGEETGDATTGDDTTTADAGTTVETGNPDDTGPVATATSSDDTGPIGTATSSGDSDTGPDEPPACDGPGEPTWESATFSFEPALVGEGFAADCEVSDIETHPHGADVALACGEQLVQLRLELDGPLTEFAVGDALAFDYRMVQSFGQSEWFTVRRPAPDGTLLLGGVLGETLTPPNAEQFFAPLSMTRQEGVCPTVIDCDNMSETIGVEFTHGDETALVLALHSLVIGESAPYRVGASIARKHYDEAQDGQGGFCQSFDIPEYYYGLMIHHLGE
ncbi:hypothetical protein [Nannocystis bainbridge]|uniref:Uncharacterized protein n=1 Tax=Nannocystis bainbridge TaxID=2995303 RepID=A0ABT5E671_9BACT|nr:hypothetical protein [Nannocystis bainbridge]MDC0720943.1 hypothetical protein [Nannocystis bainbridge]